MGTLNDHLEKHEFEMTENQIKEWIRNWSESLTIWEFTDNLKNVYRCFKSYALRYQMDSEIFYIPEYFEDIEEILTHMKECLRMLKSIHEKEITTDLSLYIQQAIAYIKNNYGRDISIPDIADAVGISEGHLRRLFKQELNVKVLDYLTEYRLECAKLLMKRKEDSLSEIWRKTGFASAQYFSYVFKRKEGILPKDYIKQIRND